VADGYAPGPTRFDYVGASDPGGADLGETLYRTDTGESKVYDGAAWKVYTVDDFSEISGTASAGQVATGDGLTGSGGNITIDRGNGLKFDSNGDLQPAIGYGLGFDNNGNIESTQSSASNTQDTQINGGYDDTQSQSGTSPDFNEGETETWTHGDGWPQQLDGMDVSNDDGQNATMNKIEVYDGSSWVTVLSSNTTWKWGLKTSFGDVTVQDVRFTATDDGSDTAPSGSISYTLTPAVVALAEHRHQI